MSNPEEKPKGPHLRGSKVHIIGDRIKALRHEKGYSMQQLAWKIGVGKSTIAGYEGKYRLPSIDKLEKLTEIFNTSTDYLLGITDSRRPKDIKDYLTTNDLVYDGKELSPEQVETLNQLLKAFINREKNE